MCFVAGTRQRLSGMPFPLKKVEFHTCIPWVIQVDFKWPGAVYAFGCVGKDQPWERVLFKCGVT